MHLRYRIIARWKEFANQPEELRPVGVYATREEVSQAISDYNRTHDREIGRALKGYNMELVGPNP